MFFVQFDYKATELGNLTLFFCTEKCHDKFSYDVKHEDCALMISLQLFTYVKLLPGYNIL